jgi:hypothetical protein
MTPWFRRVSTGFVELLNSGKGKLERRGLGALASSLTELLRTADLRAQRGTFGREWAVAVENDIERKKQRARLGEVKSSVVPPAMTDTEFWAALDELRARPDGLTRLSDADLYRFQLRLEKLVWELDTSALAEAVYGGPVPSGDDFVDVRLALVLAGPETYELAKAGKVTQDPGREEWLLYAAEKEWERRYGVLPQWDQPYSVETGSNPAAHSPARR